ncbi:MAG TPA: nuclear transport factor 2 family protein, partial [Longimicrobiales bacterium]|nr:nuclear transport factor 2 family protein [Longimicrobiales bacterium]
DWARNPRFTTDWETLSVKVAESGDLAWERGRWTFDPDGSGPAGVTRGEYLAVYEKIDGEWKIALSVGVPTGAAGG